MLHVWKAQSIEQKENGYVCLTDMAKSENTDLFQYTRNQKTQEYLKALAIDLDLSESELIYSESSGRFSRTYAHPEIAIDFAQWVSIPFRIWANRVIRDVIVKGGHIQPSATTEQVLALVTQHFTENLEETRQLKDYAECQDKKRLNEWKDLFEQRHKSRKRLPVSNEEVRADLDSMIFDRLNVAFEKIQDIVYQSFKSIERLK